MDDLKKQAEELGIKVDKRWSDQRLQAEIDEKLAADPEQEVIAQPDVEPVAVEPAPVAEPEAATGPVEPEPEPEPTHDELVAEGIADAEAGNLKDLDQVKDEWGFDPAAKAAADAEIEAEIQNRFDESAIVVTNLQANPMKVLGLTSYGEATFTQSDLARNPQLVKKLERAELLGLVKIEGK